jgi:predicted small secreted protein
VKRGVLGAGDIPIPFPTVSRCEPSLFPTSMHYRNLAALDTEAMLTAQPLAIGPRQGGATRARCLRRSRCPGRGIPSFNRFERIPPVRVSREFQVRFPCVRQFALLIWISSKSNTATAERNGEETSVYRRIAIIFFNVALLSGAIVLLNACNTTAGIGQDVSAAGHAVTNTADKVKSGM